MSIKAAIEALRIQFSKDLDDCSSGNLTADELGIKYLGRKGSVAGLFSQMGSLSPEERPLAGKLLNDLKNDLTARVDALEQSGSDTDHSEINDLDITLPGDPHPTGSIHPISQVMDEIRGIFQLLGFSVAYGPEIDTDFYNFEALNFPPNHPARDMQDTFYIGKSVLRTHTSNSQIHNMMSHEPPVKILAPGRVFRHEDISVRSYCLFHQIEGLFVDKKVTMANLKGDLDYFARTLFGQDVKTRFRPSYFPFTEPSAEMDVSCIFCGGKSCNIFKYTRRVEILGRGLVDPEGF